MMRVRLAQQAAAISVALALGSLAACQPSNSPGATSPPASVASQPAATAAARSTTDVPGPVPGTRITEAYARLLARDAFFWAWPMANIYNKRLAFGKAPEPVLLGGVLPFAPLNRMAMLTDYIDPAERAVACPNQDVVYGGGPLALDVAPSSCRCPTSAAASGFTRSSTCEPTASRTSAPCTERSQASISWSARRGRARCRQASRRFSARARTPGFSRHARFRSSPQSTTERS